MYELIAQRHQGISPELLSELNLPRVQTLLLEWEAAGARAPVRLMVQPERQALHGT